MRRRLRSSPIRKATSRRRLPGDTVLPRTARGGGPTPPGPETLPFAAGSSVWPVRVVRCAGLGAASCAPPAEGHRHTLVVPLEPRAASGCSRRRVPSRDSADGDEAQRSPRVCEYTPGREALCWHATPTGTRDCAETRYAPVSTTGCARLRQCVHPEQIPGRTLTVRRAPPPVCGRQLAATCGTPSIAASTTEPVRPAPVTHGRYVLCDPATTAGTHDRMSTLRPRDYRWHSRSYEQVRRPLRRRRTG